MTRFSVGGDEEEDEQEQLRFKRSSTRPIRRPEPKKSRTSSGLYYFSVQSPNTSTEPPSSSLPHAIRPCPIALAESSESDSGEDLDTSTTSSGETTSSSEEESEGGGGGEEPQLNRTSGGVTVEPGGSGAVRETSGPVTVTLTDPDVLDCPICLEPLSVPVYQCENGHVACGSCCLKMKNKCGSCCWPIGYNRCRAIEKVLESVKISCRYMPHGCADTITYSKKHEHEKSCNYAPCSCPYLGCDFGGTSKCLYTHFAAQHSSSSKQFVFNSVFFIALDNNQKNVFLQEKNENILFILNRSAEPLGSLVNVVCIAPSSPKKGFLYSISVRAEDTSITLKTFAERVPKWAAQPPTQKYLVVPTDYIGSNGQLRLEIAIWRDNEMVQIVQTPIFAP